MHILFKKIFKKKYDKLSINNKQKFCRTLKIFNNNPFDPALKNHNLQGSWSNHRSINITADIRAIYLQNENSVIFITIGTHSELYE